MASHLFHISQRATRTQRGAKPPFAVSACRSRRIENLQMDMMDTHLASTDIARIGRPRGFLSEPALVHCDPKLRKFSDRTPTTVF
jgi:hypothetical protein